jgi:glycosyltransferase involved in cell wall biosynthesis
MVGNRGGESGLAGISSQSRSNFRLAILTSHPIQYYAPLFREISCRVSLKVFFAHRATPSQQAAAGFGEEFEWDVDLLAGYDHEFLSNVSDEPGGHRFAGCDTPDIGNKLDSEGFDALLVTGWHLKCYWQGIWAAKRRHLPVLVRGDSHLDTPRSTVKRLAKRAIYPGLLRVFDAGLYVGKKNRAYWLHYGYSDDRLFFSPHCVDNDLFATKATAEAGNAVRSRHRVPASSPVALFAGKLVPLKRPLDLIRAAARVRAQGFDIHVLIAGSGKLEGSIRNEAESLHVPVHLMGFQNQSAIPAAYAASDLLVLPSNQESWGLVANEAIAAGRPVVVSDAVGCAPDLAADNCVGRTVPVGDIVALSEAICGTLRNPPSREAMCEQSRRYSLTAATDGVIEALDRVCGQRSQSRSLISRC